MCSLTTECTLVLSNVFSCYRMCSRTIECVLVPSNVFSYHRMCSLTTSNLGSVGIQLATLSVLAPSRKLLLTRMAASTLG